MELESWHYIALLGAVVVVFSLIMPKKKKESVSRLSSKEEMDKLELALGQFMDNMEQQHDELVNVVTTSINQLKEENRQKVETISALEKKSAFLEEQIATLSHAYVALETKYQFVSNGVQTQTSTSNENINLSELQQDLPSINPNSIYSRYSEIFELYDAGKSIEFIAKKFGKNKGEVQLIIQLAKKEEKIQHG